MTTLILISNFFSFFPLTLTVNRIKPQYRKYYHYTMPEIYQTTTKSSIVDQQKGVLDKKVVDTIVIKGLCPKTNVLMGYSSSIAWQMPC